MGTVYPLGFHWNITCGETLWKDPVKIWRILRREVSEVGPDWATEHSTAQDVSTVLKKTQPSTEIQCYVSLKWHTEWTPVNLSVLCAQCLVLSRSVGSDFCHPMDCKDNLGVGGRQNMNEEMNGFSAKSLLCFSLSLPFTLPPPPAPAFGHFT